MKLFFSLSCFLFVCSNLTFSQNKIYLRNEAKDGRVIEITPGEIKYKDPSYPARVNSVPRYETVLLFNDKGGFLVVSKPDSPSLFLNKNLVDNFINFLDDTTADADRIFTRDKKIINCNIINEDILSFIVNINGTQSKVDKSTVAAVIYKNGEHKLTSDLATAADVLYSFQMQNKPSSRKRTPVLPVPSVVKVINKKDENLEKGNSASPEKEKPEVTERPQPLINPEKPADNISTAGEDDKRYFSLLAGANSLYKRGEYLRAKYFYLKANELKPNEKAPLDGIERIDKILLAAEKLRQDSVDYDAYVAAGDSLANLKSWDSALLMYNNAKTIRPREYYLAQSIKYVQSEINRLKVEAAKREAEIKFSNAMATANTAAKEKRYEDALAAYNEALRIHPDNKFAIDRTKILIYQISQKKAADH